eukprot:m.17044 g.17044  ORF g.17044 m.17044 type:complete len:654 (+) comp7303_c0_seq1:134-2095(+)
MAAMPGSRNGKHEVPPTPITTPPVQHPVISWLLCKGTVLRRDAMRFRCFALTFMVHMSMYLLRKPLSVIKPTMSQELQVTKIGLLDMALLVPLCVLQLIGPSLVRNQATRQILGLGILGGGVVMVFFGLQRSFTVNLLLFSINSVMQSFLMPYCVAAVSAWHAQTSLSTELGLWCCSMDVGLILATVQAIVVERALGWQHVFLLPSIVAIGAGFATLRLFRMPSGLSNVLPTASPKRHKKTKSQTGADLAALGTSGTIMSSHSRESGSHVSHGGVSGAASSSVSSGHVNVSGRASPTTTLEGMRHSSPLAKVVGMSPSGGLASSGASVSGISSASQQQTTGVCAVGPGNSAGAVSHGGSVGSIGGVGGVGGVGGGGGGNSIARGVASVGVQSTVGGSGGHELQRFQRTDLSFGSTSSLETSLLGESDTDMSDAELVLIEPVHRGKFLSVRQVASLPFVLELAGAYMFVNMLRYALHMWLPMFLQESLEYTRNGALMLALGFEIGGLIGAVTLGVLNDRRLLNGRKVELCQMLLVFAAMALFIFRASSGAGVVLEFISLVILGIGYGGVEVILSASVAIDIGKDADSIASVSSFICGAGSLGAVLQTMLMSSVMEKWQNKGVLVLMTILAALPVISINSARRLDERHVENPRDV